MPECADLKFIQCQIAFMQKLIHSAGAALLPDPGALNLLQQPVQFRQPIDFPEPPMHGFFLLGGGKALPIGGLPFFIFSKGTTVVEL